MRRPSCSALIFCLMALAVGQAGAGKAAKDTDADLASYLVKAGDTPRGLCVVVGCQDAKLVVEIARASKLLVHALDSSDTRVAAARKAVDEVGLYGHRVVVEKFPWGTLPHADNTVDVVIVSNLSRKTLNDLSLESILRVLRPEGKAVVGHGPVAQGSDPPLAADDLETWCGAQKNLACSVSKGPLGCWAVVTKPPIEGTDSWPHWQHTPDNNPVSSDEVIQAPYLTQWTGRPYYIAMPAITTVADGKTFCAMGHIAHHEREEAWLHTLLARNGYNGIELWRRKLPRGYLVHRSAFIATDDVFYMIDEDGVGCLMLDPDTGREIGRIEIEDVPGEWKWMAMQDGVLYVLSGETRDKRETKIVRSNRSHWSWGDLSGGYYTREIPWGFGNTIAAYDLEKKKLLWQHHEESKVDSRAVVIGGGKVYFYGPFSHVGCLDAKTGDIDWISADARLRELVQEQGFGLISTPGFRTEPFCLYTPEALVFAPQTNMNVAAVSTEDGQMLWTKKKVSYNPNPIYVDGRVLIGVGEEGKTLAVDPVSGEVLDNLDFKKRSCARLTGCPDALFCRGWFEGVTRYDRAAKKIIFNGAMRPSCNDGVIPANGLLYIGPWLCDCNLSLMGAMALCSAGDFRFEPETSGRLQRGDGDVREVAPLKMSSRDWPVYRGGNDHAAASKARVSKNLVSEWTFAPKVPFTPTAPVAAGGLVFLGGDNGEVCAIDAESGDLAWRCLTAGPVRAAPTIWNGRAYVGSGDGYVYALEAATGRLLWRFRAAPTERRIMVYDHICSNWPVNTGVIVEAGVVYVGAGLIDTDGTYVYALDAVTGEVLWENDTSGHLNPENRKGVSAHGRLTIADGKLWMAGGNVVSPAIYDRKTGECLIERKPEGPPESDRGEEVALLNGRYIVQGGRLLYSAFENVVNPGGFYLFKLDNPRRRSGFLVGKIPPAWNDDSLIYVNGRFSRVACCDPDEVDKAYGKKDPEGRMTKRWVAEIPNFRDAVALALADNAAVVVCETQERGRGGKHGWAIVTLDPGDGEVLWREALPSCPLSGGVAINRDGQIVVVLENGKVVCFGKKGFWLFG